MAVASLRTSLIRPPTGYEGENYSGPRLNAADPAHTFYGTNPNNPQGYGSFSGAVGPLSQTGSTGLADIYTGPGAAPLPGQSRFADAPYGANNLQAGPTSQIGAPIQHAAPLGPTQGGNGLRAQMTGAGGQAAGSAGMQSPGGGQSGQIGSLYAPPDQTGQQVSQLMGRLMANLFNPQ